MPVHASNTIGPRSKHALHAEQPTTHCSGDLTNRTILYVGPSKVRMVESAFEWLAQRPVRNKKDLTNSEASRARDVNEASLLP